MNQQESNQQSWEDPAHWSGPLSAFYFSKSDTRAWVPKKHGGGWTMNIGHPRGAWWLLGFIIGMPVVIAGVFIATQVLAGK